MVGGSTVRRCTPSIRVIPKSVGSGHTRALAWQCAILALGLPLAPSAASATFGHLEVQSDAFSVD